MRFENDDERRAWYREYNKGWYQRHRERLREKRKRHDEELIQWVRRYKSELRCSKCGENHPACLHFHHRDREEKNFTISAVLGRWRYMTLEKLKTEIAKCDVLCGNCHALLHWRETHEFDSWLEVIFSEEDVREK